MTDGRIPSPHPAYLTVVLAMAGIEESSRAPDAEDAPGSRVPGASRAACQNRTDDLVITSDSLYRLS